MTLGRYKKVIMTGSRYCGMVSYLRWGLLNLFGAEFSLWCDMLHQTNVLVSDCDPSMIQYFN